MLSNIFVNMYAYTHRLSFGQEASFCNGKQSMERHITDHSPEIKRLSAQL